MRCHQTIERIEREDLVMFINACFSCTGQREFYGDGDSQMLSIDFLHQYIMGNYRRLYARVLALGVNHFNQAQIITNLLAAGAPTDPEHRHEEGELIRKALRALPAPRAMRALLSLRGRNVNNRRSRAVTRDYLASRRDPVFDAVKYRAKIRDLAVHHHLHFPDERATFGFRGWEKTRYATTLFEDFRGPTHGPRIRKVCGRIGESERTRRLSCKEIKHLPEGGKGELMTRSSLPTTINLKNLRLGSPQVCGGIRIVPVLRANAPGDLRLRLRKYCDAQTVVSLDGALDAPCIKYTSYVPHGLVVRWTDDGLPAASFGADLFSGEGQTVKHAPGIRLLHRMVKREGKHQLRLLPMHLGMEGFLALHFGGPDTAWGEYSRQALSHGVAPRWERLTPGSAISGLDDALRTFERGPRLAPGLGGRRGESNPRRVRTPA